MTTTASREGRASSNDLCVCVCLVLSFGRAMLLRSFWAIRANETRSISSELLAVEGHSSLVFFRDPKRSWLTSCKAITSLGSGSDFYIVVSAKV